MDTTRAEKIPREDMVEKVAISKPRGASDEARPADSLISDSWPPGRERNVGRLSHPVCGILLRQLCKNKQKPQQKPKPLPFGRLHTSRVLLCTTFQNPQGAPVAVCPQKQCRLTERAGKSGQQAGQGRAGSRQFHSSKPQVHAARLRPRRAEG